MKMLQYWVIARLVALLLLILHVILLDFLLKVHGTDLFHFVDGHATWGGYLADMAQDGTWGDHVILWAAANCYQIAIHVISSLPGHSEVIINPDCPFDESKHLVLGHVHEVHYVSLQLLQGKAQNITLLKTGLLYLWLLQTGYFKYFNGVQSTSLFYSYTAPGCTGMNYHFIEACRADFFYLSVMWTDLCSLYMYCLFCLPILGLVIFTLENFFFLLWSCLL